jgi:hypothetical protein
MHPCAYRVEEGRDDGSEDILQGIEGLERVQVQAPPGLWDLDTTDPSAPCLKWVPASQLDATVYAWMRCDRARPGDASDADSDDDAVAVRDDAEHFPAGSGLSSQMRDLGEGAPPHKAVFKPEEDRDDAAQDLAPPEKRAKVGGKIGDWASDQADAISAWRAWYRGPRSKQGGSRSDLQGCTVANPDCTETQPCSFCTNRYKKHKWRNNQ